MFLNKKDQPLLDAFVRNDKISVKTLLKNGANPNIFNMYGDSLLITCVKRGMYDYVELLLKSNRCRVNQRNSVGSTALLEACFSDNLVMIRLLLRFRADVNCVANNGLSPVIVATLSNNRKMLNLLLTFRADLNTVDDSGNTPLILASRKGFINIVRKLIREKAYIDQKNSLGNTALLESVLNNNNIVTKHLLKHGANTKIRNKLGLTLLITACLTGDPQTYRIVSNVTKEQIDVPDKRGNTPLHYTVRAGHFNTVKNLLLDGANPNIKNNNGDTALITASKRRFYNIIRDIIQFGTYTNVNIVDSNGYSALMYSSVIGDLPACQLLIKSGADPTTVSKDGSTAELLSYKSSSLGTIKYIMTL